VGGGGGGMVFRVGGGVQISKSFFESMKKRAV
jgi:hypothetical protein